MATLVGGIATSHTPTVGFALDAKKHDDPVWIPILAGYKPVQEWLAKKTPDVLFEEGCLTSEERDMLRQRNWRALIQYGVIFFLLEKLGAVIGTTNLYIYAEAGDTAAIRERGTMSTDDAPVATISAANSLPNSP
jgi:hypothetical protein